MKEMRPEIPIILSSGYNQADAMRRFEGAAVAGFLQKPYRAGALMDAVRAAVRGRS